MQRIVVGVDGSVASKVALRWAADIAGRIGAGLEAIRVWHYCELDPNLYPTKTTLTDQQKNSIPLTRHPFYGDWNYTITPRIE